MLEVYIDDLPTDFDDVVDDLKDGFAPLDVGFRFPVSSHKTFSNISFSFVLSQVSSFDSE